MDYNKCRYANYAVCADSGKREIFEHIFQKMKLDIYVCEKVAYKVYDIQSENWFIISNLNYLSKRKDGYYVISPYTGKVIKLDQRNFQMICNSKKCTAEAHVCVWNKQ